MKSIKIEKNNSEQYLIIKNYLYSSIKFIYEKAQMIFILINIFIVSCLFIENKNLYALINQRLENKILEKESTISKDFIGLQYPEIQFEEIKMNLTNKNLITTFYEFMKQLETKLIYLEKEINVTKLTSFYTARTLYLNKKNVSYDESRIKGLHNISYIKKYLFSVKFV